MYVHIFVTPNLADVRLPILLQLHLQTSGLNIVGRLKKNGIYSIVYRPWQPPTAAAMCRIIAKDPVSQARFFSSIMETCFREVVGMVPPPGKSLFKSVLQKMTSLPGIA